ncbi:MAG TPA: aminoglycoside phosphotransferase family protein [Bacteroidales bacterium]|nr:aminoglycoside phosphotransferase family protein [Bacteroidales bacterium]
MHSSDTRQEKESERLLREVFSKFSAGGTFLKGYPYGSGHIHDTFLVETAESGCDNYILQKLNNRIFKDIPSLQENIERVTVHLREKLRKTEGSDVKRECLTLVPALDGKTWISDRQGNFWRMYIFITNHRSYDIVDSAGKAFQGGKAIGRFQAMLADLGGEPLHETIPFFHNVEKRLEAFQLACGSDPERRLKDCGPETEDILSRAEKMKIILRLGDEGKIPLRITHNDTKFNNILLDENDNALCVIDLDTVMPGYVHYDFGDAIRTAANTAAEDETDLSKVDLNIGLYEAYAMGYLGETRNTLNDTEKEWLAFAPQLITYIIGLRFLTDHIDGDHYFKIHRENHNLHRARAQMQLVKSMEKQYGEMRKIAQGLKG